MAAKYRRQQSTGTKLRTRILDCFESTGDSKVPATADVARHDQQKYGPGKWELLKGAAAGTLDFRSDIERGSVVLAGIEESKLTQKSFQRGNRHQLIKCAFGKPLLRKLKELPTSVTRWDLYGVPNV